MTNTNVLPELKQIVGALLFAAREPLAVDTIRKIFKEAAKQFEGPAQTFEGVTKEQIEEAVEQLNGEMKKACIGLHVGEVANGYRLVNDVNCGVWIRQMLEKGRTNRLSKPALETLAIIAYRQPCTRSEIEAVRGVAVDSIMKNLIDMQLVKVVGRSELPGRPWLHGTTRKFLEYFGLKSIEELPGVEELKRLEEEKAKADARRNEAIVQAGEEEEQAGDDGKAPADEDGDKPAAAGNAGAEDGEAGAESDDEEMDVEGDEGDEDEFDDEDDDDTGEDDEDVDDDDEDDDDEFDDEDDEDEFDDEDDEDEFDDEDDEDDDKD